MGTVSTLAVWLALAAVSNPGSGFVLIGATNGVTVYRRPESSVIELAATGIIPASPDRVRAVLLDYPHHAGWLKNVAQSRVLSREGQTLVVYQRLNLPVVSDRDFAMRVRWGTEGETHWIRFGTDDVQAPAPRKGVVRVASHHGYWELKPVNGGKATRAFYRFRIDLAGSIPKSLVAPGAAKALPQLFIAVGDRAAAPRHASLVQSAPSSQGGR